MMQARYFGCILLLSVFIGIVSPLCVLESDFGFKINCAFKKSGLFRVRNLGGLKAHASIGFSLGDELGFEQSLTNLDPSRRRSVSFKNGPPPNQLTDATRAKQEKRGKQNRIMMNPVVQSANRPNQAAMDKLTSLHRRGTSTMQPIIVGPTVEAPSTISRSSATQPRVAPTATLAKPMRMGIPAFRPLPPKEDTLKVVPITAKYAPLQVPQSKGPGLAYQSELHPQSHNQISKMVSQMTAIQYGQPRITPAPIMIEPLYTLPINQFMPMPSPLSPPPTINPQFSPIGLQVIPAPVFKQINTRPNSILDPVPHQVHDLATYAYNTKKADDYNSITGYSDDTALKFNKEDINSKIAEIARAGNISMEAVEAAIALRQQQLLSKYANLPVPVTTTTTTTTTPKPVVFEPEPEPEIVPTQKPKRAPTSGKVMNAPREYYPVGYEKNFDDQFQSKVELPDTSFHCGDQKYFPGLYGDESLGCMVFHVCALTDDGLVMKSFLCPESTLFDQTILKCNWWFYVDCKNTRKLYDTNIPVSKSYQLMKALTFFSSYKKEMEDDRPTNPEDVHGVKEAITLLENQDSTKQESNSNIQIITPQPVVDERSKHKTDHTTELTPIYRENRHINSTKTRNSIQKNKDSKNITNSQESSSEYKHTTVRAKSSETNSSDSSSEIRDRIHRRRMTLRFNNATTTRSTAKLTTTKLNTTTKPRTETTTAKAIEQTNHPVVSSPLVEIIKQDIQPIEEIQTQIRQEKLIDQLESSYKIDPASLENIKLPEVKRFYRSSAEKLDKEMAVINNEKVQIIRPTPMARLVGQYATPLAVIEKLDEAILGRQNHNEKSHTSNAQEQVTSRPESIRRKKEVVTIVTPERRTSPIEKT